MSRTPAGWYPVPGGGKRFWDGHAWTSDVLGAPTKEAEYRGLAPDLPPPQTSVAPSVSSPVALPAARTEPYPPQPQFIAPTQQHYVPQPQTYAPAQQQTYLPAQPSTPPGWYPGPAGPLQWWDGQGWGQLAAASPVVVRPAKETGIAYLFWFLLGGVAAHRFYLGLTTSAVVFNIIWWGGWLLSPLFIGIPLVIAGVIWLLVDLFLIPGLVRSTNASRGYYR